MDEHAAPDIEQPLGERRASLLQALADHAPIVMYAKDLAGRFTVTNQLHAELLGLSPPEILGKREADILDATTAAEIQAVMDAVLRANATQSSEFTIPLAGELRTFLEFIFPLWDARGDVYGFGGIATEITQRKRAEEAVKVFRALVESSPDGVLARSISSVTAPPLAFVNGALRTMLGLPARCAVADAVRRFPALAPPQKEIDRLVAREVRAVRHEESLRRDDGDELPVVLTHFVIPDAGGGPGVLATTVQDLTQVRAAAEERRRQAALIAEQQAEIIRAQQHAIAELSMRQRTQERLMQAEKMAALGLLVAGIAHEIKNPLNFVNNFAELSLEFVDEIEQHAAALGGDGPARALVELLPDLVENLRRIREHGRRADAIVSAMLMHARAPSDQTTLTDLNGLVRTHVALAYQGFRAGDRGFAAEIVEDLGDGLGAVPVAYQDISRVVLNLVSNACYALRERGRQAGDAYTPTLTVATRRERDAATIRVRDNGTGIPGDVLRRIFDPFFTTKPPGEGTGLGLSMCYDIIKQLGGQLEVASEPGDYTEFKVILPVEPRRTGDTTRDTSIDATPT